MAIRERGRSRRHKRHSKKDKDDSSSCSCSSCNSGSDSSSATTSRSRSKSRSKSKSKSRNKSRSRGHSRQTSRDHKNDPIARAITPELHPSHLQQHYPPIGPPTDSMGKSPKIAMILLLGREEREFRLTEAQILYDSPNDLTSTYYASDRAEDSNGAPRTYRMPDRDPGIFEIIYRYMNREQVIPLRKSHCPKYLSYEQTEIKLAEEAKFYRLQRLSKGLPKPGQGEPPPPPIAARDYAQSSNSGQGYAAVPPAQNYLPPPPQAQYQHHPPSHLPSPAPSAPASLPSAHYQSPVPPSNGSYVPAAAPSAISEPVSRHTTRTHSRQSSSSTTAISKPSIPKEPPQHLFAFLFRGDAPKRIEPPFPIIDYPDDSPLPHLFVKATNAEIKFSAFRNAVHQDQFELRYSIRISDEPATRPLAFRLTDSTIKSVDSHLRLNGVITDLESRDIPIKIQHTLNSSSGVSSRKKGSVSENGNIVADDDGCFTSGLDELLELMSTKGYVKWSRIWQDSFDNITPSSSLHQRVVLTSCEVLFDLEFPEEAAQISAEVGGRGFVLDKEDEEDLLVRNYRINLHAIRCDTRKMRRLRTLDEVGQVADEGRQLRKQTSSNDGLKAASDIRSSASERGYRSQRYASGSRSDVGSSVSQRQGIDGMLTPKSSHQAHQPSYAGSSLSAPDSARPGYSKHNQQPSYSSQMSAVSSSSRGTRQDRQPSSTHQQEQQYRYPASPSVATDSHLYPFSPATPGPQGLASSLRPPRGHYHPNILPPDTPQTWSNPQKPHPHPQLRPQRPPASPLAGGGASEFRYPDSASYTSASRDGRRGSEPYLNVPGQGGQTDYTYGGRPRSSSAQSGVSVRTTASEEIKRRALERWA